MNKPVHLGLSVLEISKTLIYEFCYDYVKPKYVEKINLCYMDNECFIVYIKTDDVYKDTAEDVETRFDISNYELDRPMPKGKNKKLAGLMKDELGGKIIRKFVGLRAKAYSYLTEDGSEDKKAKGTKKCVIKRKLKFENYKNCLEATQLENKINYLEQDKINIDSLKKNHEKFIKKKKLILKIQHRFKSEKHNVLTEEIIKIT